MAEIFDFPLGKTHPLQRAHDRFAEAIEVDPDSIWDELPALLEEVFSSQVGSDEARRAAAAAAERTRIDCMQRVVGGEPIEEVRPKAMAIAVAAMAEELRKTGKSVDR